MNLTPTRAWQVYQLLRVLGALAVSVIFARMSTNLADLAATETVMAVVALVATPVLTALTQAYLQAMGRSSTEGVRLGTSIQFQRVGGMVLMGAGLLVVGATGFATGWSGALLWALGLLAIQAMSPLLEPQTLAQGQQKMLLALGLIQGIVLPAVALGIAFLLPGKLLVYFSVPILFGLVWRLPLQGMLHARIAKRSESAAPFPWRALGVLLLTALAATGGDALDALLVRAKLSATDFLIFRYGAREFPLTLVLATAASAAFSYRFSRSVWAKDRAEVLSELLREHRRLILIGFGLAVMLIATSDWLVAVAFPPQFATAARLIDLYALLVISRVLLPQAVLLGLGRERTLLIASLCELGLHLGLTLLLLPWLGVYAPAIAALAAYTFEKIFLVWRLHTTGVRADQVVDFWRWGLCTAGLLGVYAAKLALLE